MIKRYNGTTWNAVTYSKDFDGTEQFAYFPVVVRTFPNAITAWTIKGNTKVSGTPSPQNPVTITGLGNKTANLFNIDDVELYQISSDQRYAVAYTETGTYSATAYGDSSGYCYIRIKHSDDTWEDRQSIVVNGSINTRTMTVSEGDTLYIYCATNISESAALARFEGWQLMVNKGQTILPYEPPNMYKISILKDLQPLTPIYLGSIQSTRQIYKLVLTGNENWTNVGTSNIYGISVANAPISGYTAQLCSHFVAGTGWSDVTSNDNTFGISSPQNQLVIHYNSAGSIPNFKTYLQQQHSNGTPVTIWYVLATAETGIVNEPLMKIGDYSDSIDSTQSGVTIPTTGGTATIDVDTTVKPSELDLTYHGWHTHEPLKRENGQWV